MFYCALLFPDERSKFLLKFLLKFDYRASSVPVFLCGRMWVVDSNSRSYTHWRHQWDFFFFLKKNNPGTQMGSRNLFTRDKIHIQIHRMCLVLMMYYRRLMNWRMASHPSIERTLNDLDPCSLYHLHFLALEILQEH